MVRADGSRKPSRAPTVEVAVGGASADVHGGHTRSLRVQPLVGPCLGAVCTACAKSTFAVLRQGNRTDVVGVVCLRLPYDFMTLFDPASV